MDTLDLNARAGLVLTASREAGLHSMRYFQSSELTVDWKQNNTEVTRADRECEAMIRSRITGAFPDDAIVGEEHEATSGRSGWTWYIDPIDGTRSFARGVPLFAVLIGVAFQDRIVTGVIELPALGERVFATDGQGAVWDRDGHPRCAARVSTCQSLSDALVCTTSFDYFKQAGRLVQLDRLHGAAGSIRGWSDAYAYALAATGRVDAALDPVMKPWDNGPFPVIFREAGGLFTSWSGQDRIDGGDGLAANRGLHTQLLALLE